MQETSTTQKAPIKLTDGAVKQLKRLFDEKE
jgi:hypothetical protein